MGSKTTESTETTRSAALSVVDALREEAPGGKSVIALLSTAAGGTISRIVPQLEAGAPVTTSRSDIYYVATEFGLADLRGKSLRQRALALAQIAHPRFRDSLLATPKA